VLSVGKKLLEVFVIDPQHRPPGRGQIVCGQGARRNQAANVVSRTIQRFGGFGDGQKHRTSPP